MKLIYAIIILLTISNANSSAHETQWETDFYALLTIVGKPWSSASLLLDKPSSINLVNANNKELIYSYCTIYVNNSIVTEVWFKEDDAKKCIPYSKEIFEGFTFCGGLFQEKLTVDIFLNFIGSFQYLEENKSFNNTNKWIKIKHYYWLDKGLELITESEQNASGYYGNERISSLGIKSELVAKRYLKSLTFPTKLNNLAFFLEGNKSSQLLEKLLGKGQLNSQTDRAWQYYYPSKGFGLIYDNVNKSFTMLVLTNTIQKANGSQYPYDLPFGLIWAMTYNDVVEMLGQYDQKNNINGQIEILYQQKSMALIFEEKTGKILMIQFGKQSASYLH